MTNADIQKTINSLSSLTDTTSRQTVAALRLLAKEILCTNNYVTEEDRLNQAVTRLIKFWSRQSTSTYALYIKVISKLKNKMYSFSEVEKLAEELDCPTFNIFLNKKDICKRNTLFFLFYFNYFFRNNIKYYISFLHEFFRTTNY